MINKLKELKNTLQVGDYICVIALADSLYTSRERGVKPLLELLSSGTDVHGNYAADKVVGKAAAFIYAKLGISALYALVVSVPALEVLKRAGITVIYDELSEAIRNRRGDGFCPMESAVMEISDYDEAIAVLRERVAAM